MSFRPQQITAIMGYTDLDQLAINTIRLLAVCLLLLSLSLLIIFFTVYPALPYSSVPCGVCGARGRGNETPICPTADKRNPVSFAPALDGYSGLLSHFCGPTCSHGGLRFYYFVVQLLRFLLIHSRSMPPLRRTPVTPVPLWAWPPCPTFSSTSS